MKYLVVGAGATGGAISSYMAKAGKEVSLIARGDNLTAIREHGVRLTIRQDGEDHTEFITGINACSADEYIAAGDVPDVIFLCTKSYSVADVAPFIESAIDDRTIIIPILNGIQMGKYVRRYVKKGRPIDGCIYISARRDGVGGVYLNDRMFRIIFGAEGGFYEKYELASDYQPDSTAALAETLQPAGRVLRKEADTIAADLRDAGIRVVVSDNILRDTLRKFSCIASLAGTGLYCDGPAGIMQTPGEPREFMCELVREVEALANAMGVTFDVDLVQKNLAVVDNMSPDADSSLQRDIRAGHVSEFDQQILEPIRLGMRYGLEMPAFRKVAEKFGC